jgi:hypothetical protein
MKTTIGMIYKDGSIRIYPRWFIAKRIGNFNWQDKTEVNQ